MGLGLGLAARFVGPGHFDEVGIVHRLLSDPGLILDVGAHYGESHADLVERGWHAIALEPDPENRARIPQQAHVTIDPRAVSKTDGETVTLYTSPVSSGITSLAPFHPTHTAAVDVQTVRLDTLLSEHGNPTVDLVKVDTEGFDLPVLQTFPWTRQHPKAVVCEFEDRKTIPLGYTYRDLGDLLVAQGYTVFLCEWFPIVEYGQAHDYRRTVAYPADVAEPDAWGNFVAVVPELADAFERGAHRAARQLRAHKVYSRLRSR
jgi:FkbM family methyltransferase